MTGKVVQTSQLKLGLGIALAITKHFFSVLGLIIASCLSYDSITVLALHLDFCLWVLPADTILEQENLKLFVETVFLSARRGPPFSHFHIQVLAIASPVRTDKAHLLHQMNCSRTAGGLPTSSGSHMHKPLRPFDFNLLLACGKILQKCK